MKFLSLKKYLALPEKERVDYGIKTKCEKCGKYIKRNNYDYYIDNPNCSQCCKRTSHKALILTNEPIDARNALKEEVLKNISKYNKKQKILFNCPHCGKETIINAGTFTINSLCRGCRTKQSFSNKSDEEIRSIIEKTKQTCLERYGVKNVMHSNTIKNKIKQTFIEKYGVESPFQVEEFKLKAKKTTIEHYGVEYASQCDKVKEKVKKTTLEHFGEEYLFKSKEFKERSKKTCLERYGVENPRQNNLIKEKAKQTCLKRYGTEYSVQSHEIKEKTKQTCLKKYGHKAPACSDIVKEKTKQTCLKKYGVNYSFQSDKFREKAKQTFLEKYGVENYSQCKDFISRIRKLYIYKGNKFDSSWELYYWIWATETGRKIVHEPIRFEYELNNKKHYYFPDFEIDGQLVEIKGPQFFSEDGKMVCPFDSTLNELYESKHQCGLKHNVKFITDISKVKEYVESKYTSDFVNLFRTNLEFPYPNVNLTIKTDKGLIQYFHKSIYTANVRNLLSPIEAWQDKDLVYKIALNRLKYVGSCKPSDILQGFSVTKKAPKVSVFNPALAKRIVEQYASEYSTIFDPFSGFSGRMLGAIRNGKDYIGQDLSEVHIEESQQLLNWVRENQKCDCIVTLKVQNILTDESKTFENTCLFTCSPYGSKETWNEGEVQMSCDEWIDKCLEKYKCDRYIFVVDETLKYNDYIKEEIVNKSHFGSNKEYIIII